MPLGISEEHLELHGVARRWVATRCGPEVARAALDADGETMPPFWDDLAKLGWLGLPVSEAHGGEGYGLVELGVVLEELGRAVAPGPYLPSVLTAAVVERLAPPEAVGALLAGLVDGTEVGTTAVGAGLLTAEAVGGRRLRLRGTLRPVVSGALAHRFVVPGRVAGGNDVWCVLDRDQVAVAPLTSLDATRPVTVVTVDDVVVEADRVLTDTAGAGDRIADLAVALFAAEAVGSIGWCVDTAAEHARTRVQFGRPIGQFQAVKHRCADMLVSLEAARAAAWDALGAERGGEASLAAAVAGAIVPAAANQASKDCIQVLGGTGFTWEHDAHLHLKRAASVLALVGGAHRWRRRVAGLAADGHRRTLVVGLPPEAESFRRAVRDFVAELGATDRSKWNDRLADAGYVVPSWPEPWGRGAGPVEQLVIDEELRAAGVHRPYLGVAGWVLPTIIGHGTDAQQQRWVPPSLRGELRWCQLFSEPGAGSDLAALTTKAVPTGGGWLLTGQKVWTTLAHASDLGLCLARSDPGAPRHEGITCFVVDMAAPGVDIRPLRELTGHELFNEVFLDDVFVPDDDVVGPVHGGWACARTTLGNERVSMGSGSSFGPGVEAILDRLRAAPGDDAVALDEVGAVLAEAQAVAVLGLRTTLRAVGGAHPGAEASVRKLLGVEHDQRVQELGLALVGTEAAAVEGDAAGWIAGFLGNRALSIAGGTSEIQRNVIAERLLGLPRDP